MSVVTSTLASLPSVTGGVSSTSTSTAKNTLDKDSFLKLLTTQLQKQDPLSPMDSNAFVAQLAQFAQVEGLDNLGRKMDSMVVGQANANQMSVANLVGKQVTFRADHLAVTKGVGQSFDVSLSGASASTIINITDSFGRVVRTLDAGARPNGSSEVKWDGLDESGTPVDTGDYYLTVTAKALDGSAVTAASAVRGVVAGVDFDGTVPQLVIAGQRVKLGDVTQIGVPPVG